MEERIAHSPPLLRPCLLPRFAWILKGPARGPGMPRWKSVSQHPRPHILCTLRVILKESAGGPVGVEDAMEKLPTPDLGPETQETG